MRRALHRAASWLARKTSVTSATPGFSGEGPGFVDRWKRQRSPGQRELLQELKGTAWTCASINASVCAKFPPRLYVASRPGEPAARCPTRPAARKLLGRLRARAKAERVEEVTEHPLLTLLEQVNGLLNGHDLWELTTLYQEVHGSAYWLLVEGAFGVPDEIHLLPTQCVRPVREPGSRAVVDYYEYTWGYGRERYDPEAVIAFHYPDPNNPCAAGLAPLRAVYEQALLASMYHATKGANLDNHALPAVVISPDEAVGEEERDRLEEQWNQKFRRGGTGRALVAESGLKVQVLSRSLGDLAALADLKATKEDIANAFGVPLSYLTSQTNLANLQAARVQHMELAIHPRLVRRDQKLNERLVPLFDPTGRLFVASEDPVPDDLDFLLRQERSDLFAGVRTINEVRSERGLPPVPWGDEPFRPSVTGSRDPADGR